jgi:hypothetical protein
MSVGFGFSVSGAGIWDGIARECLAAVALASEGRGGTGERPAALATGTVEGREDPPSLKLRWAGPPSLRADAVSPVCVGAASEEEEEEEDNRCHVTGFSQR